MMLNDRPSVPTAIIEKAVPRATRIVPMRVWSNEGGAAGNRIRRNIKKVPTTAVSLGIIPFALLTGCKRNRNSAIISDMNRIFENDEMTLA